MWEDKLKRFLFIFIVVLLLLSCFEVEADEFTSEFYFHVNNIRESRDLIPLIRNVNIEKVATTYSEILAKNGSIDHFALTEFEFNSLCTNYDVPTSTLLEVLASAPSDYFSYQIFLLFMMSEPHKKALLDPAGRFIGAGYSKQNGNIFFTAYVMIGDKS